MRGAVTTVIAPWGMKKFLVLSDAQRESLRFHLDAARVTPYLSTRHALHVYMARSIAGLIEEDKPARVGRRTCARPPAFVPMRRAA